MSDEIHKKLKDESQKIVEEHKEEQRQIWEKLQQVKEELQQFKEQQQIWEKLQQVKEELQQFKEQHNHLIEPDPMSNVVKVSWIFTLVYVSLTFIDSIVCKRIVAKQEQMLEMNENQNQNRAGFWIPENFLSKRRMTILDL